MTTTMAELPEPVDRSRCQFCGQMVPVGEPGVHRKHHNSAGQQCEGTHQWVDHSTYVYGDGTPHLRKAAVDARSGGVDS